MVQQRKYYFQGMHKLDQVGKLQKFLRMWRSDKKPLEGKLQGVEGSEPKVPLSGGGSMDSFLNYTMHIVHS